MFAFSQIIAEGENPTKVANQLDIENSKLPKQVGLSEDQAQAALLAYQSEAGDFADVMRGYIDDLNTRLDHVRLKVERGQSYAALANLGGISQ